MSESTATYEDIKTLQEATVATLADTDAVLSPWLNAVRNTVRYAYRLDNDRIDPVLKGSMGTGVAQEGATTTWELDVSLGASPDTASYFGYTSLYSLVQYTERPSGILVQRRCWAPIDGQDAEKPTFGWELEGGSIGPTKASKTAFLTAMNNGYNSPEAQQFIDTLCETDPDYAVIMAGHIAQACGMPEPKEPYDGPLKEILTAHPERPVRADECQQLAALVSTLTVQDQVARTKS